MTKIVLTFGLIAGAILSAMLFISFRFHDEIGFDRGEIVGYASMVAAFLLIFFGIRSYRDNVASGAIRFGRALAVGTLIAAVASLCYVPAWALIYSRVAPDFVQKYQAHIIAGERADGATEAEIAAKTAELDKYAVMYRNPVIRSAITFVEPMPVALVISLVSAGVLSRRRREET